MSDVMLLGVLGMPLPDDPAELGAMTWLQFRARARQAAERIASDADEIERLRSALRGLLDAMPSSHLWDEPTPRLSDLADGLLKAKAVARDALHGA